MKHNKKITFINFSTKYTKTYAKFIKYVVISNIHVQNKRIN